MTVARQVFIRGSLLQSSFDFAIATLRTNGPHAMKIRAIDISRLDVATPPPRNTYYPNNSYVVVRVKTDEGIEGLGYTMLVGGNGASSVQAYLRDNLAPLLEGED